MTITHENPTREHIDLTELGLRIDDEGLATVVAALRDDGRPLADLARAAGVGPASLDILVDSGASDVAWMRAYVAARAGLARCRRTFGLVA